jgi:hypothetical protein
MLFQFQLRPVADVAPWGNEGDYSVSWFGLTDGWYWLKCGDAELFRYTDAALKIWAANGIEVSDQPYVDYQVVRLWEDILQMLPDILDPIPERLLRKIEPGLEAYQWHGQIAELVFTDERDVSKQTEDQFDLAITWLQNRKLDSLYLKEGPKIWFWSDGTTIFIRWDNTDLKLDGHDMWASLKGTYSMPIETFLEEVKSFDQRLIKAMDERVQSVQRSWDRPWIRIDKESVLAEQEERATALSEALRRVESKSTGWDEIVDAVDYFEWLGCPLPKTH